MSRIYDDRACFLGEGALWHPLRNQLFWFDIINKRLMSQSSAGPLVWQFDEIHSAAGWVDADRLLIASETGLWVFDIATGSRRLVTALEADRPDTRCNDGRADPMGGFWIGTMGKSAEAGAGSIYRYYRGELRKLVAGLSIPNAICFAPDGRTAYYTCTLTGQILRLGLDTQGWPVGQAEVHIDLRAEGLNPDGAVTDAEGNLWNAQWGAGRVACYRPDGSFAHAVSVGGVHSSCPAFGGADLTTLFVTTAQEGLDAPTSGDGLVYSVTGAGQGRPEPQVVI